MTRARTRSDALLILVVVLGLNFQTKALDGPDELVKRLMVMGIEACFVSRIGDLALSARQLQGYAESANLVSSCGCQHTALVETGHSGVAVLERTVACQADASLRPDETGTWLQQNTGHLAGVAVRILSHDEDQASDRSRR